MASSLRSPLSDFRFSAFQYFSIFSRLRFHPFTYALTFPVFRSNIHHSKADAKIASAAKAVYHSNPAAPKANCWPFNRSAAIQNKIGKCTTYKV